MATKLSIAKKIFACEKETILNSKSFQEFFSENQVLQDLISLHLGFKTLS